MQGWNSMQVQFAAPLQQYKITKYNTVLEKNAAKDIVQNSTVYCTEQYSILYRTVQYTLQSSIYYTVV
jgi:hypothetical protein